MHKKTFRFRIYPTKSQTTLLNSTLEECRWVFNETLATRKNAWQSKKKSLSKYDTHGLLTTWKKSRPTLKNVHSQVLQNVQERVDLAFKAYFRRVKLGDSKVGYPRFRGTQRYDSFCYPQFGFKIKEKSIHLSKIGDVKIVLHRQVEGNVKTCTARKTASGNWHVTLACEVEIAPLPKDTEQVGIDVGLKSFAFLSNGESVPAPKFFRMDEGDLARIQRRQSKNKTQRDKHSIALIHKRIVNRRSNFAHQLSRRIVDQFGLIAVEDIEAGRMVHNHCLAKSILDAAWSNFLDKLAYKAGYADRAFVKVPPAYTSQDCSACGHRQLLTLSDRTYNCPCCGLSIDRDLNASLNVLSRGRATLGIQSVEAHDF